MADDRARWARQDEAFWRAHHETWKRSDLNQRGYREAQGIPLKAFGNWRAKFKTKPEPPGRKLLYRRRGVSHRLSHTLSHGTYPSSSSLPAPVVPAPRAGHRQQQFSEANRRRILNEAAMPGASVSEVAQR